MLMTKRVDEGAYEAMKEICRGHVDEAKQLIAEMGSHRLDWKDTRGLCDARNMALALSRYLDRAIDVRMKLEGRAG